MYRTLKLALCGAFVVSTAHAADVLVYGPSLAIANCGEGELLHGNHVGDPCESLLGPPALANEATVAADNGHVVTVVDALQWAAMTRPQFEAYDAIVIGDAGCDFSNGEDTETLNDTRGTWNPAVTGNVTINTFDAFYHIYQDADSEAGARALAGSGINYAASGEGTGLYYSNGCRSFTEGGEPLGGDVDVTLDFLSGIGTFRLNTGPSGDSISLVNPGHPAVVGATNANLSSWGNSTHAYILQTPGLELLAQGSDGEELGGGGAGDVIYAGIPVGGGPSILEVPTLSSLGLAGFGLLLAALAAVRLRRA